MKLQIIQIGNSLGVRIPKSLLELCGLKDSVIAKIEDRGLMLSPDDKPRLSFGVRLTQQTPQDNLLIVVLNMKRQFFM